MAKIARVTQKIFGSTATGAQLGVFGSLAAGTPTTSATATSIQSLSQFLGGWFSAIVGGNSPSLEDWNSLCYLYAYQIAYGFQSGVPEYDSGTTYFIGSLVNDGNGMIYRSKTDTNLGNALTSTANWGLYQNNVTSKTANYTVLTSDDYVRCDPSSASFTATLPAIATCAIGERFTLKNVATNGNTVTVAGNAAELIDQANTIVLDSNPTNDSITVINGNGVKWDII